MGHEARIVECRGRCDTALPGNMGKLMRSTVVRSLREGMAPQGAGETPQAQRAPEINVCCHGQDAGDQVARTSSSSFQAWHAKLAVLTGMSHIACTCARFRTEGPCQTVHSSLKVKVAVLPWQLQPGPPNLWQLHTVCITCPEQTTSICEHVRRHR